MKGAHLVLLGFDMERIVPWTPDFLHKKQMCRDAWVAQSVEHLTSAQVMIVQSVSLSPASGSVLTAWSLEPGACFGFCVSLSLCPSPAHALSLSVSEINKD